MMIRVVAVVAMLLSWALPLQAETFKEGEDFTRLVAPVQVADPNKIEVREFFWFGCPHCYQLEAILEPWKKTLADDVAFVQTPAPLNKSWIPHAHAFYVAEALERGDELTKELFHAIHGLKKARELADQEGLAGFFAEHGVNAEEFEKLYHSFSVRVKVRNADALAKTYRLSGVPAMVVNGKYVVQASMTKSFDRMMRVVEYLVAQERLERQPAAQAAP